MAYFGEDDEDDADASDVDGEQHQESRQQTLYFPAEKLALFMTGQRETDGVDTRSCEYTHQPSLKLHVRGESVLTLPA